MEISRLRPATASQPAPPTVGSNTKQESLENSKLGNEMLRLIIFGAASLVVACTLRGFKAPPPSYEEFAFKGRSVSVIEVKAAMVSCGYSPVTLEDPRPAAEYNGLPLDEKYGPKVMRLECMFQKGFYFKSGWGGYCSMPDYRNQVSACKNIPPRPINDYYGQ